MWTFQFAISSLLIIIFPLTSQKSWHLERNWRKHFWIRSFWIFSFLNYYFHYLFEYNQIYFPFNHKISSWKSREAITVVIVFISCWFKVPEREEFKGRFNFSSLFPQYWKFVFVILSEHQSSTFITAILTGAVHVTQTAALESIWSFEKSNKFLLFFKSRNTRAQSEENERIWRILSFVI